MTTIMAKTHIGRQSEKNLPNTLPVGVGVAESSHGLHDLVLVVSIDGLVCGKQGNSNIFEDIERVPVDIASSGRHDNNSRDFLVRNGVNGSGSYPIALLMKITEVSSSYGNKEVPVIVVVYMCVYVYLWT